MNRMEAFEADWADRHDIPAESLVQYRHADGSGYKLPDISKNWRTWNAALDSVVIKIPDIINCGEDMGCAFIKSIEAAGLKVES